MKILIIGSGGREHAIAVALKKDPRVSELICAPGNGGLSKVASCYPLNPSNIDDICNLAKRISPDLVVVSPDDPLVLGAVDALIALGFPAFGPNKAAAQIEGSKSFAKTLMKTHGIPTAEYEVFDDYESAAAYVREKGAPIVIKADGLALGKGVTVAKTFDEAQKALKDAMVDRVFGNSGSRVVIEECLSGPEVSIMCFTDGVHFSLMPSAQDHKRAYNGDLGPNTGGMGAFSPSSTYTPDIAQSCLNDIFKPTINALSAMGCPFKGVLYFGLMLTKDGPKVIEYNARFGDPEAQAVLPLLKTSLLDIMLAIVNETLCGIEIEWEDKASTCLVLASGGYPGSYVKGYPISGIEKAEEVGATIYHAGTAAVEKCFITAGGRVLGVTALGDTLSHAAENAYAYAKLIEFQDMHFRKDIGIK